MLDLYVCKNGSSEIVSLRICEPWTAWLDCAQLLTEGCRRIVPSKSAFHIRY
jgi:hypothetical protein